MKLIKPGRPQKGWAKEAKCTGDGNGGGGCGAELLIEEADLYITSSSCRDETDYYETFTCAACGVETDMKGVPTEVHMRLPKKEAWKKRPKTPETLEAWAEATRLSMTEVEQKALMRAIHEHWHGDEHG